MKSDGRYSPNATARARPDARLLGVVTAIGLIFVAPLAVADDFTLPKAKLQIAADCRGCPPMLTLPSGLRMSQSLVTVAQFRAFAKSTKYDQQGWGCRWYHPNIAQTDNDPVVCITFEAATKYVDWLSRVAKKPYLLPSLDEYRYAAMAGQNDVYWWGTSIGVNRANCIGCGSKFDGKGTSPVKTFAANPFGLLDAVGNAWQWSRDCQEPKCTQHFLIGGSWNNPPGDLRLTKVIWNLPNLPFYTYGLRVVANDQVQ